MKPRLERDGVLVLDKPVGISSFDAIRFLRSRIRIGKIGHTGTLDPLASGVLPIVLNRATRLSPWLSDARKGYEATLVLGEARDTQDATGRVVERAPIPELDAGGIERVLETFLGAQTQIPPMYSAVHHEGRRLYELAREGIEVARPPRRIEIDVLRLLRWEGGEIDFRVICSKGTYIRTLATDIAHRLGTVGHLSRLRRIRSGPFGIEEAHPLEEIAERIERGNFEEIVIPPVEALPDLPALLLSPEQCAAIRQGRAIRHPTPVEPDAFVRLLDPSGALLAIGIARKEGIHPKRVIAT